MVNGHAAWYSCLWDSVPSRLQSCPTHLGAFCVLLPIKKCSQSLFFMKFFRKPWTEKKKWFNGLLSRGTDPQDSTTSLRMQMGNTCALMASILFFIISLF